MSSKANTAPFQVNHPDDVRNVVLVGNAGSGKTSLFEQLLLARTPGYRGEKDTPERLSQLYLASLQNGDVLINLLDAPGHPDFVGELRAGLRAADAAIFVVSAADDLDAATRALWAECAAAGIPRVIALTKLDAAHDDFDVVVEGLKDAFGAGVLPSHVPVGVRGGITGTVGVLSRRFRDYRSGAPVLTEADADHEALVEPYRGPLLEGLIEEAEDDALMDSYLEGTDPGRDLLLQDLMKATAGANLYPVVPVVQALGLGAEELLSLMRQGFPTASLHPNPETVRLNGDPQEPPPTDPDAPLVAQVIRTTTDPFAGRLSMVRIFSGSLATDDVVHVSGHRSFFVGQDDAVRPDHDDEERIGQIQYAVGTTLVPKPSALAGEIVMIPKLTTAETGDTLTSREDVVVVPNWRTPPALHPVAIRAATRNDEGKLAVALQRLALEDTAVRVSRGVRDQLVLWTTGQAHADLLLARLTERYGVNVVPEEVRIGYRETLVAPATALGRHVKQSGGHGQYAVVNIEVAPLPRGEGFVFVDKVVGGAVPRQFIPSVEKGIRQQLERGVATGHPMVDVQVTLTDGKAHSVDSSDMAFQMAGAAALKEAAAGNVALLEPIDRLTITVHDDYKGAVMTDLPGRRGQMLGSDTDGRQVTIEALVPQAELARYAIDLRGMTHGTGTFTRAAHGYELLPPALADQLVE